MSLYRGYYLKLVMDTFLSLLIDLSILEFCFVIIDDYYL